ncbi:MAG TPA: phosphoribosylformylglycinamidine synthase subunit PurQ [Chitinophagaceae bacterium]|nr:phosphoribosylformylglycinamidine synthase subunit PurQ [Chitinophagaceae bacterium]
MKFGVVIFPGSNCDRDAMNSLREDMGQEVIPLWHKDRDISMFSTRDCIILPGGFSYGDYLRCGALARFSPMMESVAAFAGKGGTVLGICNGFQILCESGLLPGVLVRNASQQFVCQNIYITTRNASVPLTRDLVGKNLRLPIAHGEGRYLADPRTIESMTVHDQVLFRYCSDDGQINEENNPNGSMEQIAGITNRERNVYGLMPHPERATSTKLGNTDGRLFFLGLIKSQ